MKRNYARLIGKIATIAYSGETPYLGIVTGADFSIGITIQEKDTKEYMLCMNGPTSPHAKYAYANKQQIQAYQKAMRIVHDCIVNSKPINPNILINIVYGRSRITGPATQYTCAFSQ